MTPGPQRFQPRHDNPIHPGATIGILGGGQLGRMMALAARSMGYRVHALDPDPHCPISALVGKLLTASFSDSRAAGRLAQECAAVTIEIEKIATSSLAQAAQYAPVRPGVGVLFVVQDRARQKDWLARHAFPLGHWKVAESPETLYGAAAAFGFDCYVKSCQDGYDGRCQFRIRSQADAKEAGSAMGDRPVVVEKALEITAELSVLVARRSTGQIAIYPPALNHHVEGILRWAVIPAPLPHEVLVQAQDMARGIAEALALEGLLTVEMFLVHGERLLVNELAPRPHNSYHASEQACATSQFEQAIRVICDLPLGSVEVIRPAAIVNLLGDLWDHNGPPQFSAALDLPGVRLHLYDKQIPHPRRKMGHLSAFAQTPEKAIEKVCQAHQRLTQQTPAPGYPPWPCPPTGGA